MLTEQADYVALEAAHNSGVYAKRDLALVRGAGATVWDAAGRAYLDCTAGYGVASVGHCHPAVVQAIQEQAAALITCPEMFYNDQRALLLDALHAVLPAHLDRAFLCNSGTEAVEAALKFARAATGRNKIVATMRGFHGRTMGALSATWEPHYRAPFGRLLPDVAHIPYNDVAALAAVDGATAAVIVEVVQGEGGVRPGTAAFLQAAQAACRASGALLILDEVQTGFGRTGRWFALEHHGLAPDLLVLAKALGGGMPIGAVAISGALGPFAAGIHGSTFGGNPLACAAARATIGVLRDERLPERAAALGAELVARLRALRLPLVREVRGLGLMVGLELRSRVAPVLAALQQEGVLALAAGPAVLRLLPPLVVTSGELEVAVAAISRVLAGG